MGKKEEQDYIIKEDIICPVTKIHCDDECCPEGAICNLKNSNGLSEPVKDEKKDEQLREDVYDFIKDKKFISQNELVNLIYGFTITDAAKQYHYSNDGMEGLREKFNIEFDNDKPHSDCIKGVSVDEVFDWFLPHLKQQESDAVEFDDVFEFNNWVKKHAAPDLSNGQNKWQTLNKRNLTVKELYQIFKSNNNGNT